MLSNLMNRQPILFYVVPTLLMFIQFNFFHGGYFGYDEVWYSKIAASVLSGEFTHFHLYSFRYGMFLPLALLYQVFGINDFSNFLFNIIQHWVVIYIILQIMKSTSATTKWIALLYYICLPIITLYLEKPMPDVEVMTGFTMMLYGYYQINFLKKHSLWPPVLWFVIGSILTFLAKETFLIFYPIYLGIAAYDVLYKKINISFWKWTTVTLTAFVAVYLLANYFWFGDPLKRAHTIFAFSYVHDCAYDHQPIAVLLKRITYELWFGFVRTAILLPILFLPLLWKNSVALSFNFFYKIWIACMLLANFMTISYTSYVPLCPDPRHFMFAFPVGAIVFANGIQNIAKNLTLIIYAVAVTLIMLWISIVHQYEHTWFLYIPLIIGLILYYLDHVQPALVMVCIGIISMFGVHVKYNAKVNYKDQKKLSEFVIDHAKEKSLVVSDGANATISGYIGKFDTTMVRFVDFEAYDMIPKELYKHSYLIMNGMTRHYSNLSWEKLPPYAQQAHENLKIVYKNNSGEVYLLR